jgi:hypothetical protein
MVPRLRHGAPAHSPSSVVTEQTDREVISDGEFLLSPRQKARRQERADADARRFNIVLQLSASWLLLVMGKSSHHLSRAPNRRNSMPRCFGVRICRVLLALAWLCSAAFCEHLTASASLGVLSCPNPEPIWRSDRTHRLLIVASHSRLTVLP